MFSSQSLINEILDAPLGHVDKVLGTGFNCKIDLDLIEQYSSKPGSEFIRKIIVTANNLPLIKAVIKFDKTTLPKHVVSQLLQKRNLIGMILSLNNIPNKKNIISLQEDENKIIRVYQIIYDQIILFEVSEEIRMDYIELVWKELTKKELLKKEGSSDEKFQSFCWEAMGQGW